MNRPGAAHRVASLRPDEFEITGQIAKHPLCLVPGIAVFLSHPDILPQLQPGLRRMDEHVAAMLKLLLDMFSGKLQQQPERMSAMLAGHHEHRVRTAAATLAFANDALCITAVQTYECLVGPLSDADKAQVMAVVTSLGAMIGVPIKHLNRTYAECLARLRRQIAVLHGQGVFPTENAPQVFWQAITSEPVGKLLGSVAAAEINDTLLVLSDSDAALFMRERSRHDYPVAVPTA